MVIRMGVHAKRAVIARRNKNSISSSKFSVRLWLDIRSGKVMISFFKSKGDLQAMS